MARTSQVASRRPERGEVRVLVGAVGVSALGTQVAGTVDAVAKDSIGFARGDRVAFSAARPPREARVIVAEHDLIGVPADIDLDAAAAVFPCASLARTVIKQVHSISRGTSLHVAGESAIGPFVRAWADHLGATEAADPGSADVVVTGSDIRTARTWRAGQGLTQQAAADVFAAIRAGAFDGIPLSTPEQARNGSRTPVLLHPAELSLAA